jgi:hypothetical protein
VIDNALGAVARLILTEMRAIPLEQVVPVIAGALPLREDMAEYYPIYQCLLLLSESSFSLVSPHEASNYAMCRLNVMFGQFSWPLTCLSVLALLPSLYPQTISMKAHPQP